MKFIILIIFFSYLVSCISIKLQQNVNADSPNLNIELDAANLKNGDKVDPTVVTNTTKQIAEFNDEKHIDRKMVCCNYDKVQRESSSIGWVDVVTCENQGVQIEDRKTKTDCYKDMGYTLDCCQTELGVYFTTKEVCDKIFGKVVYDVHYEADCHLINTERISKLKSEKLKVIELEKQLLKNKKSSKESLKKTSSQNLIKKDKKAPKNKKSGVPVETEIPTESNDNFEEIINGGDPALGIGSSSTGSAQTSTQESNNTVGYTTRKNSKAKSN